MKLVVTTFLTLDGVYQAPGGIDEDVSGGFEHGGWLVPYADEDFGRLVTEKTLEADAFLLGRKTYEMFATYWPRVTDPSDAVAAALNGRPKYVASRTLRSVEWNNSSLLDGDVAKAVDDLKRRPGGELQVHGSGALAQTLIGNDLVDEYRLWLFPVVVGGGKRLFEAGSPPSAMTLVDTKATGGGAVLHTYRRAGRLRCGTIEADRWREALTISPGRE